MIPSTSASKAKEASVSRRRRIDGDQSDRTEQAPQHEEDGAERIGAQHDKSDGVEKSDQASEHGAASRETLVRC